MSRGRERGPARPDQSVIAGAANLHGGARKDARKMAKWAAMGQVGNSVPGQGFLPETPIVPTQGSGAQNEGQPNI